MAFHDHSYQIKTNTYKLSYIGQILMDLLKIFSIGPQCANKYEVNLTLTQPHLPSFVMTYHDLATQLNQIFISQPNLDGSPRNFQHRPTVGKQI